MSRDPRSANAPPNTRNQSWRAGRPALLQTLDGDGVAFDLTHQGHHLPVGFRCDLVLVAELVDLAIVGHQDELVAVADAARHALDIGPHSLTALGARQVDDIAGYSSGNGSGGRRCCGRSGGSTPAASTASSTAAWRV